MKNYTLLRYLSLFGILIALSNCSTDTGLEILEETNKIETFQTKSGTPNNNRKTIYMKFNFSLGATQEQKDHIKMVRVIEMSQHFAIYERWGSLVCEDEERWVVNRQQYLDYLFNFPNETEDDDDADSTGAVLKPGCIFVIGPLPIEDSGFGLIPIGLGDEFKDEDGNDTFGW